MNDSPATNSPPDTHDQSSFKPAASAYVTQRPWYSRLAQSLPGFVVLSALVAIGFVGHRTGWKLPKYGQLFATADPGVEWCLEHNVPESDCVECIPDLNPDLPDFGWCKLHGIHQCPHCHPEVAQLKNVPKFVTTESAYLLEAFNTMDRTENNLGCNLYRSRIQFTSAEAVSKAGIDVEPALTGPIIESLDVSGEITYDADRVAHISSRAEGVAWRVYHKVGDPVESGDVLALIDSAEVGQAKSKLLDALNLVQYQSKVLERISPLAEKQAVTGARMLDEQAAMRQAEIQLQQAAQVVANLGMTVDVQQLRQLSEAEYLDFVRFLGIPEQLRQELQNETSTSNLLPVFSTMAGLVTERHLVQGEVVKPAQMLFQVVDTSAVWLVSNVALEDAKLLKLGQTVQFRADGATQRIPGSVSWISTDVNEFTRTVEVRSELDNSQGLLRNNTFGTSQIVLRTAEQAVLIPDEAVQWDGSCYVVFVRGKDYFTDGEPKLFYTRSVRLGVQRDGKTEIIAGLLPGEVVATRGSNVLRSQILKNKLGAGCTCGH